MNLTADALSFALLHSLWQDAIVGVLLGLALVALRHRSANARYVVCCAALALMAALPVATMLSLSDRRQIAAPASLSAPVTLTSAAGDTFLIDSVPATTAGVRSMNWIAALTPWMLPLWLAGVVLCSLRLVMASLHTVALTRQSVPEDGPLAATVSRLAARIGVARSVSVRVSAVMTSPATLGFLRPVILLPPAAALGVTPHQLEALLAHELAHVRRHDYFVNALQMIAETLFFYHPVVWWTSRRIRIERELCCDDIAVAACGDAISYAQALTVVARRLVTRPDMAMGATGGPLLVRVQRLLGVAPTSRRVSPLGVAAAAVAMIVALMLVHPYAQSRAPEASTPTAGESDVVLRGRVVDAATGSPVSGASVRAQYITGVENPTRCPIGDCEDINSATGPVPVYRVTPDTDGRFDIRGMKPGDYLVAAVAPGYVQGYFGKTSADLPEMPVHVAAGQRTTSIDVRIERAGSLGGRILSDAGEGLPGVEVELLRHTYLPGGSQPVAIAFAQTEERGVFRFRDVTPGAYYVRAYANRAIAPTRKNAASLSYAATYFPETTDLAFAQSLYLASGQELAGVDFALMTAKMSVVSGRLVDPNGASLATALIHLIPFPMGVDEVRRVPAAADGRFRFDNVAASRYMLTVSDTTDGRSWNTAVHDVAVPGDVTDLLLVAGPSVWLEGHVVRDDGRPLPFDASELSINTIQQTSSAGFHGAGSSKVESNGNFLMRSGTGRLSLGIGGVPSRWFVKSVQLDGVDITDASFDLTPGRLRRLDITLSDHVSKLTGTVTDRSARPVPNALVIIFPDNRDRWTNTRSILTTFSRQQGGYEIDGLPIANYRVVAVTSLPNRAWTDPDVLERLWPSSSPLSLDGLGESALHLKVVAPPADLLQ